MFTSRPHLLRALGAAALLAAAAVVLASAAPTAGSATPPRHAVVRVFAPRGEPGARCTRVLPLRRTVATPAVLTGALRALLAGPTVSERQRGYGGWFSARTAGALRSVHVDHGIAFVDLRDLRHAIPNASSSCGSATLLAQLDRTAKQFPTVNRVVYAFRGDEHAFYEWLQRSVPAHEHHVGHQHHDETSQHH